MKKLLLIFLLFPLFVFGQAEKTHRAIIIDSIKAFNGGIIDVKDTLKQDIGIKFNDGTFQSTAAIGAGGDSSFVILQWDTAEAFNNTTLQFNDTAIFNSSVGIGTNAPDFRLEVIGKDASDGSPLAIKRPTNTFGNAVGIRFNLNMIVLSVRKG